MTLASCCLYEFFWIPLLEVHLGDWTGCAKRIDGPAGTLVVAPVGAVATGAVR
jgi:hypothetical protein